MKFSEKWLRESVNPDLSTVQLTDLLTMGGMEVDGVEPAAEAFSDVVTARIIAAEPHPDADKLQVCQVDCGASDPVNIVCGAANARVGLVTALAKVGAVLPNGLKIKRAKLRGVESFGMLCSASELGLENMDNGDGIIELQPGTGNGEDLRDHFDLDDSVIEVDLTPNRGDCFSIKGIARDLSVLSQATLLEPEISNVSTGSSVTFPVDVQIPEACPHYAGRVIEGINSTAETPLWMSERLRRSGVRTIHPVVDITNYVMLELGQPMHAFDLNLLDKGIVVRSGRAGEKLTLLDQQKIELLENTTVIADHSRVLALAGVMGGLDSSVTDKTADIFLESAFFTPESMAGKARHYKAQTDSSQRFERGVDYQLQVPAIERATALILEICGGTAGEVSSHQSNVHLPKAKPILLRRSRVARLLGQSFSDDFIGTGLSSLGMNLDPDPEGWNVIPPSHRFDIEIEADLIEEIARVASYDSLPASKAQASMAIMEQQESRVDIAAFRSLLVARGYQEAITYSFVEPELQSGLSSTDTAIALANPISMDMSQMRVSILPGLLKALEYNLNRQNDRVLLFETGLIFNDRNGQIEQKKVIAGIACGNRYSEQWDVKGTDYDFFDLKNDVEALLGLSGNLGVQYKRAEHTALHPGQSANLLKNDEVIGFMGMLSPVVLSERGLDTDVGFFQLDLETICTGSLPEFKALSKFPMVRRDISLLIDKEVPVDSIFSSIETIAPETLINLQLFDVYQGEGIDSLKKSVALGLTFQGTCSTLTDDDIDTQQEKIIGYLNKKHGVTLRV